MSFRCDGCGEPQENGRKPIKFVAETRKKIYPKRYADPEHKICIDNGGTGIEIVREMNLCPFCKGMV